ncbi:5'-AMP-activated serine/threonine-protein kinase catalytic subunit alpha-like [Chironomus tepperi]|uniref:5'-AMP-activated serine/threonine-protein kinase catalytic subunit alpha-like n=1 Tax=Chironomus tepperi TaxID=113505 RepID=UPI00391F65F1
MLWILRRTGAVNFFNSINNNSVGRSNSVNFYNGSDSGKNTSRRRFRYGRLSVEPDDQNYNQNDEIADNLLVDTGNKFACCDEMRRSHCNVDKNGNRSDFESDSSINNNNKLCKSDRNGDPEKGKLKKQNDQKTISRLQAIGMTDDDDDFDESLCCNVCDRAFQCPRQLASHQQKKRHFGCGGCDTLFPSLMLLEHHKEEYEHWSDSEEYQSCCRRNRRDDCDFSDSETCTSDAESEDLERLL